MQSTAATDSFEIKARITSLSEWNKPVIKNSSAILTSSPPPELPQFEIDPNYIALAFQLEGLEHSFCSMLVRKEDIKRLNLTVGDGITIKVISKR